VCLTKLLLPYLYPSDRLWQKESHMDTAYVTSKGQLVVPSRIRRRFGIKPGTRINFVEEGDHIIFQPVTREYIESFCGIFKQKPGEKSVVQEHLEERRAERDRENRK
jgi:AbrB family looped-hinge helix DNA binding protein